MTCLGQQDRALSFAPADLVRRVIISYPTDFKAKGVDALSKLNVRGEQLTLAFLEAYMPDP